MSEQDENTQVPTTEPAEAPAQEPKQDLSLAEELSKADDKTTDSEDEEPETPVEEVAKPEETEEPTEPEEKPKEEEEPVETEAERKQRFYELRQAQKLEKQRAENLLAQTYQPQKADELTQGFIDQGYSQFEAEMLARDEIRNQRDQINTARTQVAELNMRMNTESVQVMHDFPVFDPKSPDYDKDFADKASAMYSRAANVQTDPQTGVIISTNLTPYNFYKELADMRGSGVSKAQIQGQRAAEQQMASVAPPSSTAPVTSKSKEDAEADRLRAAFDKTA